MKIVEYDAKTQGWEGRGLEAERREKIKIKEFDIHSIRSTLPWKLQDALTHEVMKCKAQYLMCACWLVSVGVPGQMRACVR